VNDTARSPLVSVVVPVHNGGRHLVECIESILAQTYQHWECVVVDNHSTDETATIAARYAARDARIRVCRTERLLSAAANHNFALAQMSTGSRYCKFVQADDWLFPECIARMVEVGERHPSVGIIGAYRLDGDRVNLDGLPYPSTVVAGRDLGRATLLGQVYVFGSPTSVMIRAEALQGHSSLFDESTFPRHWDGPACLELLRTTDFGFVHQVLTYTRRPPEARTSLSRRIKSYWADELVALHRYGPMFLDPDQIRQRRRYELTRYYAYLGRNLLRRDPTFWSYHRRTLAALGLPISRFRLAAAAAVDMGERVVRPLRAAVHVIVRSAGRPAP
jgi:glycosyltransferase involved in cell wall biosynthesis